MSHSERTQEAALHEVVNALTTAAREDAPPTGGALPDAPCAICRLVTRSVERTLRAFFAEFVNDPQARAHLRQAQGFCAEHTPQLASLGDALAIAILYADLAELHCERWRSAATRTDLSLQKRSLRWSRTAHAPRPGMPCLACVAAQEAQDRYTGALGAGLEDPTVWDALEASAGLCVAHTDQVLAVARPAAGARLRQREGERLAALQKELEEIIRKSDYRFRGEPWGPEKDAWRRALLKITRPRS